VEPVSEIAAAEPGAPAAIALGTLLGLIAYGTNDFTNLATIKGWPAIVSLVDLAWGTTATAISAVLGYFITRKLSDD
jgi:uncharacterized membrane protein